MITLMFVDCLGTVRWFRVIVMIMFSANVIPVLQVGTYRINQVAAYCFTVQDALKLHYTDFALHSIIYGL